MDDYKAKRAALNEKIWDIERRESDLQMEREALEAQYAETCPFKRGDILRPINSTVFSHVMVLTVKWSRRVNGNIEITATQCDCNGRIKTDGYLFPLAEDKWEKIGECRASE